MDSRATSEKAFISLILLCFILLLSTGEAAPPLAQTPPQESFLFDRIYREELAAYGLALFKDVKTCHASAKENRSKLSDDIEAAATSLGERRFEATHDQVFSSVELWTRSWLVHQVPIGFIYEQLNAIELFHRQFSQACLGSYKNGGGRIRNWFKALSNVDLIRKAQWVLTANRRLGGSVAAYLLDLTPDRLLAREPFLREPWFREVLSRLLSDPIVKKHLRILEQSDAHAIQSAIASVLEFIDPIQIVYEGMIENNPSYPFIRVLSEHHFQKPAFVSCFHQIDDLAFLAPDTVIGLPYFDLINKKLAHACPQLTDEERLAILAIEDRMISGLLPLSYKRALAKKPPHYQFETTPSGRYYLAPDTIEQASENRRLISEVERVTRLKKQSFVPRAMDHVDAPAFTSCHFSKEPDQPLLRAAIFLGGIAYQVLDAEASRRILVASTNAIVQDALQDLHLWDQAISYGCGPSL